MFGIDKKNRDIGSTTWTGIPQKQIISNESKQATAQKKSTNSLISTPQPGNEIWFAVQIAAATGPIKITSANFKGEKGVQEKKIGVYYKYFLGHFELINEAIKEQKRLYAEFPGSFVVKFKGEQPILASQAKNK